MAIERNERAVGKQSLFREVNERVVALVQGGLQEVDGDGNTVHAICECAEVACHEPIELSIEEYTAIRSSPLRFLVKAGHQQSNAEQVTFSHDGYIVVEKIGEPGEIATDLAGSTNGGRGKMTYSRPDNGYWRAEELEVLRGLQGSLEERVEAGDTHARLALQVVVVFIAKLAGPRAVAADF